jgi:hypothetical protein
MLRPENVGRKRKTLTATTSTSPPTKSDFGGYLADHQTEATSVHLLVVSFKNGR